MAKAKIILILASALALQACNRAPQYSWECFLMDGHRTGVKAVIGEDFSAALGVMDSVYTSPSGRVFECGSTPLVAKALLDVQPRLAHLKEKIGYCPDGLEKFKPESPLSNWAADAIMLGCEAMCGKKVDIAIANFGGIRADMPKGDILVDDIVSMFPFRNYYAVVELKGRDVRKIFEHLCGHNKMQPVSGVRVVAADDKLESLEVGGRPLDDNKVYRVGTIDFLLDGGDGLYIARNALSLKIGDIKLNEWLVPYVRTLNAAGEVIEAKTDGRIVIK